MKFPFLSATFIITFYTSFVDAQNPLVKQWDYRYGGLYQDLFPSIIKTNNGGYLVGGFSSSIIGGDKTSTLKGTWDYWIVKLDPTGHKQWDKDFGGASDERLYSMQQTTDGGYILGGFSKSDSSGDKTENSWYDSSNKPTWDYWIVKIDSIGNKQWDKRFGGNHDDNLYSLQQTTDGGYILAGYSASGAGGDITQTSRGYTDYWIVKVDSLGNKQWDKRFGGNLDNQLASVCQTNDGGYILGGWSSSGISGDKTQPSVGGSTDYWLVKIDSIGNKQWDKTLGGSDYDNLFSLQITSDNGYILGGTSGSGISGDKSQAAWGGGDYWIVKTDSVGNKQWDKSFGGTSYEEFNHIETTNDGGYLLSGTSYSNISGNKSENNLGKEQAWIVKTDASGNKQWDKTLRTNCDAVYHDENGYAIQANDGCYVFENATDGGIGGDKTQPLQGAIGDYDYWIIKFCDSTSSASIPTSRFSVSDTLLCISESGNCVNFTNLSNNATSYQWLFPGGWPSSDTAANPTNICYSAVGTYSVTLKAFNNNGSDSVTKTNYIVIDACLNTTEWGSKMLVIVPNPSNYKLTISFSMPIKNGTLKIFSVMGEEVYSVALANDAKQEIQIGNLAKGIYFVRVNDEERTWVEKVVVE